MPALRPLLRTLAGISGDAYALISATGLAIGFAVFFLLGAEVRNAFSFDSQVPQVEQVYLLKARNNYASSHGWKEMVALPFRDVVANSSLVQISSAEIPYPATLRGPDGRLHSIDLSLVDPGFIDIFAVHILHGDMAGALSEPHSLSLGTALAQDIFGRIDVVGETVRIAGEPYTVRAVHADPPSNTVVPYVALAGLGSAIFPEEDRRLAQKSWAISSTRLFVKLPPGSDPVKIDTLVQQALEHSSAPNVLGPDLMRSMGRQPLSDLHFVKLRDAYFDEDVGRTGENGKRTSKRNIVALAGVACLALLMAVASHTGLAASRALARRREIGVRKTLGASSTDIGLMFLAESAIISLMSIAAGLLLSWLLAPLFMDLIDLRIDGLFDPAFVAGAALAAFALGTAAGIYPAWLVASVRSGQAQPDREAMAALAGNGLRQALTGIEFAAASACAVLAIAIAWQANYSVHRNPGFDPAPLLTLKMPVYIQTPAAQSFVAALRHIPGVSGVASSLQATGRDHWSHSVVLTRQGHTLTLELKQVSPEFFRAYDIHALAGRLFAPDGSDGNNHVTVLNPEGVRALGFDSFEQAVGQSIDYNFAGNKGTAHIIGVAPSIRYENLREPARAISYALMSSTANLTIRVDGGPAVKESARKAIATIWAGIFPDNALEIYDPVDLYRQDYQEDLRLARIMSAAAAIAVAIAGFGMYALAVANVRGRAREIVLRKLYGASGRNIALFVARHTMWPALAGALAGICLGAVASNIYLEEFTERAPMAWWPLLLAGMLAFLIAALASLRHTLMAMRLAPSIVLRY